MSKEEEEEAINLTEYTAPTFNLQYFNWVT